MKKVIILGALGMAGHIMAEYLDSTKRYAIYGIARTKDSKFITKTLDVKNFSLLEEYIKEVKQVYSKEVTVTIYE